uniref:RRM domain-containing protein n=1 Tax=Mesocestoides corti TaxID=53468 RepID=A0A5K3F7V0_MESCO
MFSPTHTHAPKQHLRLRESPNSLVSCFAFCYPFPLTPPPPPPPSFAFYFLSSRRPTSSLLCRRRDSLRLSERFAGLSADRPGLLWSTRAARVSLPADVAATGQRRSVPFAAGQSRGGRRPVLGGSPVALGGCCCRCCSPAECRYRRCFCHFAAPPAVPAGLAHGAACRCHRWRSDVSSCRHGGCGGRCCGCFAVVERHQHHRERTPVVPRPPGPATTNPNAVGVCQPALVGRAGRCARRPVAPGRGSGGCGRRAATTRCRGLEVACAAAERRRCDAALGIDFYKWIHRPAATATTAHHS